MGSGDAVDGACHKLQFHLMDGAIMYIGDPRLQCHEEALNGCPRPRGLMPDVRTADHAVSPFHPRESLLLMLFVLLTIVV